MNDETYRRIVRGVQTGSESDGAEDGLAAKLHKAAQDTIAQANSLLAEQRNEINRLQAEVLALRARLGADAGSGS